MKKVTAVVAGAGLRGMEAYAVYALEHPEELEIVAVAEPNPARREKFAADHHLPPERVFTTWEDLLAQPRLADAALICTQDRMHYAPVLAALDKGYHVLCEKPMSPNKQEILAMGQAAEKAGRILSICHVLRYSPFFRQLKKLLDAGTIGQLVSIQAMEGVGYYHAAHSFVRGNWRNSQETSPMILQKCCHDMDILLWLVGKDCRSVSSYGSLNYFNRAHQPAGAPDRCSDGCPHAETCPYNAQRFYLENKRLSEYFCHAVSSDLSEEGLREALRVGPYGRCVFACDNDVVDHQVVNLNFEDGITASFTMCDFTARCTRTITLMGTKGQLWGDMGLNQVIHTDFRTGKETAYDITTGESGHGGSDEAIMREFVETLRGDSQAISLSSAKVSVQSHLMVLAAEESRLTGQAVTLAEFAGRA